MRRIRRAVYGLFVVPDLDAHMAGPHLPALDHRYRQQSVIKPPTARRIRDTSTCGLTSQLSPIHPKALLVDNRVWPLEACWFRVPPNAEVKRDMRTQWQTGGRRRRTSLGLLSDCCGAAGSLGGAEIVDQLGERAGMQRLTGPSAGKQPGLKKAQTEGSRAGALLRLLENG
ncbi:hypothetical protein GCM10010446_16860 [Streptomyces enissocaesilis]|uniref:Transposase n=1 Tax=Streptomyces enissocaesilis TaxID=332589 RepID=A0ABP6JIA6_9ACTN